MDILDRLSSGWKAWIILFFLTLISAAPGVFNLPSLDRDESRFAQSSKQYLETGDYIVLRYQDELRNKKPAGIHWLQAGSTAVLGDQDRLEIWTYRVPSWIGAALAALATFWAGSILVGRRAAFIGAALFGSTLLLTSEAHISKTDAVLVFLTAAGIGALARLYVRNDQSKTMALLFWGIMGASFLIKGPVTPMVAAYAGFGAWVWAKSSEGKGGDWWRPLIWWPGPLIFVALVLPWFIWIQLATDGQYIQGAVGKDLKDKFAGASEGHAGWPLYHLTHIPAWFFPGTLLIVPAAVAAWSALRGRSEMGRRRGTDALFVFFALGALMALATWILPGEIGAGAPSAYPAIILLGFWFLSTRPIWQDRWSATQPIQDETKALRLLAAWAVLTTIFFELMPTRLSHYVLPAYPAYALLCGWVAERLINGLDMPVSRWISIGLFLFGGGLLLLVSSPLAVELVSTEAAGDFKTVAGETVLEQWAAYQGFSTVFWWIGGIVFVASAWALFRKQVAVAVCAGVLASLFLGWHARISFLPTQIWVQPTETARLALEDVCGVPGETCESGQTAPRRFLAMGYTEPSLIMTLGTQNLHDPETPIGLTHSPDDDPIVYLFNLEHERSAKARLQLEAEGAAAGYCVQPSNSHYALNYSNGDPVHFVAVRFDKSACPSAAVSVSAE